jgi:DUF177 domain-containing protein
MKSLIINIKKLSNVPLDYPFTFNFNSIEDRLNDILHLDSEQFIKGNLSVLKKGKHIYIESKVEGFLNLICSRCLKPAKKLINNTFNFTLSPEPVNLDQEIELDRDDLEIIFYSGESIELGSHILDFIILELPDIALCSKNCTGIEFKKISQEPTKNSCWDALKDIKIK